jgi:hypothetical protein
MAGDWRRDAGPTPFLRPCAWGPWSATVTRFALSEKLAPFAHGPRLMDPRHKAWGTGNYDASIH